MSYFFHRSDSWCKMHMVIDGCKYLCFRWVWSMRIVYDLICEIKLFVLDLW